MPALNETVRKQLLLYQFLVGLPQAVSLQLRAAGEMKYLDTMTEWTRLLLTLNEQDASYKTAAIMDQADKVEQLREQITTLIERVAALSAISWKGAVVGHLQHDCPFCNQGFLVVHVTYVASQDTLPDNVRETIKGRLSRAASAPFPSRPWHSECWHYRSYDY